MPDKPPLHPSAHALAIIPARGGSKSIPRKNVRPIAGKPLIAWTIEAALAAHHVERVIVSTDDAEIGAVARAHGAEVVWRPAAISGDLDSSESALLHALGEIGGHPPLLVFLQCTSPLTTAEDIDGTVDAMIAENADTALAVKAFHYFLWTTDASGSAEGINHDKSVRLMRQQRQPQWQETGAVYVMKTAGFLEARHRFFGRTALYEMPAARVVEIDEPSDFDVAEHRLRVRQQRRRQDALPQRVRAVVFDFDGVFTDNKVHLSESGQETVVCDRSDGAGIAMLRAAGVAPVVISAEVNPVVKRRCEKLQIPCLHGIGDKWQALRNWLEVNAMEAADIVYVGNDTNDLACLRLAGCGVVVADAHPDVLPAARVVLDSPGGRGAVREVCDLVIRRNADGQADRQRDAA
jgi:YrbI family 3-deoxy-D-manno-octulosonate 8-phosphate phosphatase